MGIRFLCPNGHKLNVKADLAGKRASCPDCGAKLVIPAADSDGSIPAAIPASNSATNGVSPAAPRSGAWYVRPASGGQFGPAADDLFCAWIAEGRVSAEAHVWRDGWAEWKLARDAADLLPMPLAAMPVVAAPVVATPIVTSAPVAAAPAVAAPVVSVQPVPQPLVPAAVAAEAVVSDPVVTELTVLPASQYLAKRRRGKNTQLTLAIVMLAAVIVLAGVLIWVLRRDGSPVGQAFPSDDRIPVVVRLESLTYESEAA